MASHLITRRLIPLALAAGLAGFANSGSAVTLLEVNIDTPSLTGTVQLAFDLTNGDGVVKVICSEGCTGKAAMRGWIPLLG